MKGNRMKKEKEINNEAPRNCREKAEGLYHHVVEKKKVLNTREAAALLKTTRAGIWNLVQKRAIPFIRVSARRLLFFEEDLLSYLESRTVQPSQFVDPFGKRRSK